jgi:hypothetical protein
VTGVAVAGRGEALADLAGFGGADGRVAGEGFLPVMPGLTRVSVAVIDTGQATMGVGLVPWRVGLGSLPERGGEVVACVAGVTGPEEYLAEAIECVGLQLPVAVLAQHDEALLETAGSLPVGADFQVDLAELDQDL